MRFPGPLGLDHNPDSLIPFEWGDGIDRCIGTATGDDDHLVDRCLIQDTIQQFRDVPLLVVCTNAEADLHADRLASR